MEALPGAGLGGLYAFVMIMAAVILNLLGWNIITAKTYLRGSILVTLALCIVVPLIDDTFVATGSWLIFLLTGFHVVVFATSYLEPFNRRPAAEERQLQDRPPQLPHVRWDLEGFRIRYRTAKREP